MGWGDTVSGDAMQGVDAMSVIDKMNRMNDIFLLEFTPIPCKKDAQTQIV
jgi:hypothetical protein